MAYNRADVNKAVAEHLGWTDADGKRAVDTVLHVIGHALAAGEQVRLTGFGTFEKMHRPARTMRNPATGEPVDVPAKDVPAFRAGEALKELVNSL